MDLNAQKEKFSVAYVHAVAAVAGVKILRSDVDDDSIDVALERSGGCAPKLDVQLKCTANRIPLDGDLTFDLKKKNYDDLRRNTVAPRWLVILHVPELPGSWLNFPTTHDQVILYHCAWWVSLEGFPDSSNDTSVRVTIPRQNLFTPDSVKAKMNDLEAQFIPV